MSDNKKIQIIKHEDAKPLSDGDILYPFEDWDSTDTAGGWYTNFPDKFYTEKDYLPLTAVSENPWDALIRLGVNCFDFKEQVQFECPYNHYMHYWCVPVIIFTDDVKSWIDKHKIYYPEMYLDKGLMRKFYPPKVKNGLPFSKIQRALLGPGYTGGTRIGDGSGYLYDTLLALDNGDFLGAKVWMWFNK